MHRAVSSSLSFGLSVYVPLLPTSLLSDAVTFHFETSNSAPERTCTSLSMCLRRRTRVRRPGGVLGGVASAEDSGRYTVGADGLICYISHMERKFKDKPPRLDYVSQSYDPPLYFLTLCTLVLLV